MNLYVIILLDLTVGPYVWSDKDCPAEAEQSASEARHETGYDTVIKCIEVLA